MTLHIHELSSIQIRYVEGRNCDDAYRGYYTGVDRLGTLVCARDDNHAEVLTDRPKKHSKVVLD